MAVRYYIQHILWGAADQWAGNRAAGVTNYKALLDRIRRWVGPEELVAVATFNYDTLVEHALMAEGMSFPTMASFIENPRYKLFKLHGSVSWCRVVDYLPDPWPERESDDLFMRALTLKAPELRITNTYCVVQNCPTGLFERRPAIPAIAVPIAGKSEFECPTDHVGLLRTLLPQTKRIVIVGWRAGEAHFLELLRAALPPGVPSLIACGSRSDANMTSDTIKAAGVHTNSHTLDGGFTELIVRRELDGFLADYWKAT